MVDDDGENKVESKEPEKTRDPAGQLRMILTFGKNIYLMTKLTCSSSREVAV